MSELISERAYQRASLSVSGLISDDAIGQVRMPMFFGFLGLINTLLCQPILVLLHMTGGSNLPPFTAHAALPAQGSKAPWELSSACCSAGPLSASSSA